MELAKQKGRDISEISNWMWKYKILELLKNLKKKDQWDINSIFFTLKVGEPKLCDVKSFV